MRRCLLLTLLALSAGPAWAQNRDLTPEQEQVRKLYHGNAEKQQELVRELEELGYKPGVVVLVYRDRAGAWHRLDGSASAHNPLTRPGDFLEVARDGKLLFPEAKRVVKPEPDEPPPLPEEIAKLDKKLKDAAGDLKTLARVEDELGLPPAKVFPAKVLLYRDAYGKLRHLDNAPARLDEILEEKQKFAPDARARLGARPPARAGCFLDSLVLEAASDEKGKFTFRQFPPAGVRYLDCRLEGLKDEVDYRALQKEWQGVKGVLVVCRGPGSRPDAYRPSMVARVYFEQAVDAKELGTKAGQLGFKATALGSGRFEDAEGAGEGARRDK